MSSDGRDHWDDEPRIELRGDPAYRQGGADYGAEHYYEEEAPQQRTPVRRFAPFRFALAGLALLVFAALLLYAYSWGTGRSDPEELPLIAAPAGVEKEPPSDPGGMEVRYQDSMLLNPGAAPEGGIEQLLPPPEEPQPRERLAAEPEPEPTSSQVAPSEPAEQQGEASAEAAPSMADEPIVEEALEPEAPAAAAEAPGDPAAESAPEEAAATPETAEPQPAPQAEAPVAEATSGDFMIQLASAGDRDAIQGEWTRLQERHPEQLARLQLHIEQADLGERGIFYRLQAGPLSSREAADSLCGQLQARQQDCLVRAR